jgi:hypothetical protein
MMSARRWLFALSLLPGVTVARAETIDGRVRLGFDGAVLQHTTMTTTSSFDSSSFAPADATTSITLAAASFGAVLGYATSEHFTLATRFAYAHSRERFDTFGSSNAQGFDGDISCAYVFGEGALRPFLGPLLGYRNHAAEFVQAGGVSEHWFTIGARLGAHLFAAPSFSIDPSIMLGYATGSGERSFVGTGNYDIDGFVVGLHVAISGWIGGTK